MLQTLKGREDPRNKADNPNPIPAPDIFCKDLQRDPTRLEPAIFSSAESYAHEPYIREALESSS